MALFWLVQQSLLLLLQGKISVDLPFPALFLSAYHAHRIIDSFELLVYLFHFSLVRVSKNECWLQLITTTKINMHNLKIYYTNNEC